MIYEPKNVRTHHLDSNICHGKPCIRGLRYPVEIILEWLSSGMTIEEILADYEDLQREDILEALDFATKYVGRVALALPDFNYKFL